MYNCLLTVHNIAYRGQNKREVLSAAVCENTYNNNISWRKFKCLSNYFKTCIMSCFSSIYFSLYYILQGLENNPPYRKQVDKIILLRLLAIVMYLRDVKCK